MLGMKSYPQDDIDACRARVEADLRAYREQVGEAACKEFEVQFFNAQVLTWITRSCTGSRASRVRTAIP
jgi:hypothetical protein